MKFKVAVTTVIALFATLFGGAISPASAASPKAAVTPSSPNGTAAAPSNIVSSSLAQIDAINISTGTDAAIDTGYATRLDPIFAPTRTSYQGFVGSSTIWIHAKPATPTSVITFQADSDEPVVVSASNEANGFYKASLNINNTQTNITVTVSDSGKTNTVYRITENQDAAPTPRIVSFAPNSGSVLGGEQLKMTLAGIPSANYLNNENNQWTQAQVGHAECYVDRIYFYDSQGNSNQQDFGTQSFDPINGFTVLYVEPYNARDWATGDVDVSVSTVCLTTKYRGNGSNYEDRNYASTRSNGLYKYVEIAKPDLSVIPDTFTAATTFTLTGTGWTYNANTYGVLYNPETDRTESLRSWDYTGNDSITYYIDRDPWYLDSGTKVQLRIFKCDDYQETCDNENPLVSKDVIWNNPEPQNISVSPAFDNMKGGKEIKIKGQFLDMDGDPDVYINGQEAEIAERVFTAYSDYRTFDQYINGTDTYKITVPASSVAGKFDVTVDTEYSTKSAVARTKFIYGDTPIISSISPASVSKLGGSQITLVGKNFGLAGTPIVTIGGEKSPYVQRISDSKVVAVVPASTTTGAVEVQILSSVGGGAANIAGSVTYTTSNVKPVISAIAPATSVLAGGGEATITGTGFGANNSNGVTVDGKFAKVTASSATSITFEVPDGDALGATVVKVSTPAGNAATSAAKGITYVVPAGIASVTPNKLASYETGDNAKVVIAGSAFGKTGSIVVGSQAAQAYSTTAGVRVNANGTSISGVVVNLANQGAGSVSITVTPTGATKPFTAAITVNGPSISYVGPVDDTQVLWNSYLASEFYGNGNIDTGRSGQPYGAATGDVVKIRGKGFGATAGTVTLNTSPATVLSGNAIASWTDTQITFAAPAVTSGLYDVTVAPIAGFAKATQGNRLNIKPRLAIPNLIKVAGVASGGLQPNATQDVYDTTANPKNSKVFRLTGTNFLGSDPAARKVYLSAGTSGPAEFYDGSGYWDVTPVSMTDTSMDITLPSEILADPDDRWLSLYILNSDGFTYRDFAIYYMGTGIYPPDVYYSISSTPGSGQGFCGNTESSPTVRAAAAKAAGYLAYSYDMSVYSNDTLSNADSFGSGAWNATIKNSDATGTAVTLTRTTSSAENVVAGFTNQTQATNFGAGKEFTPKTITVTGTGNPAPGHTYGVDCKLTPDAITTSVNGINQVSVGVDQIAADTGHTLFNLSYALPTGNANGSTRGFMADKLFSPVASDASSNPYMKYEFVNAITRDRNRYSVDHSLTGVWTPGVPTNKGSYYVRVRLDGSYDQGIYNIPDTTPARITVTAPTLHVNIAKNAADTIVYKGAITTSGSTPGSTATDLSWNTGSDPVPTGNSLITNVNYMYRDVNCSSARDWRMGLPSGVTYAFPNCGATKGSVVDYQVQIASVDMKSSGSNAIINWNIAIGNPVTIKVTPRPVKVTLAATSKYYDGATTAAINASDVLPVPGNAASGVIPGDVVGVKGGTTGTFAQSNAGTGIAITFDALSLNNANYELQDPPTTLSGTIKKSTALISASVSPLVMLCPGNTCSGVTAQISKAITDVYSGRDVTGETSGSATDSIGVLTYTSKTPAKCSVDQSGVITAVAPGQCQIALTQDAAANFTASKSFADPASKAELVDIVIVGDKKTPSVIVDQLTLSTVDLQTFTLSDPTVQFSNLLPGDSINGITFKVYNGAAEVLQAGLAALPVGTYTVKASGGTVSPDVSGPNAYTSTIKYVDAKLIVTPVPPTIVGISPRVGPEAGGTSVTITGTNFDRVTAIVVGDTTIRAPRFTVGTSGDKQLITFVTPAGYGSADVTLVAGKTEATDSFTYIAPANPVTTVSALSASKDVTDGGLPLTLTGKHLERVSSINFCGTVLYPSDFTVAADGASIDLFTPAHSVVAGCTVTLVTPGTDPTFKFTYVKANGTDSKVTLSAKSGSVGGGLPLKMTGTHLQDVTIINFCGVVIAASDFTVNAEGTSISLITPKHVAQKDCVVKLVTAGDDPTTTFTYAPLDLNLDLNLDVGAAVSGADAVLQGGGLKPATTYTLEMHSKVVVVYTGKTDKNGNFTQKVKMPAKACVNSGRHELILSGISPEGKKVTSTQYLALTDKCVVLAKSKTPLKAVSSVAVGGFLFDYGSAVLTKDAKASLNGIAPSLMGAKKITLTGYTQTNLTSKASKVANLKLAQRRAVAVRDYLQALGVKSTFVLVAKGPVNPVSVKKQKLNRRVEIDAEFLKM